MPQYVRDCGVAPVSAESWRGRAAVAVTMRGHIARYTLRFGSSEQGVAQVRLQRCANSQGHGENQLLGSLVVAEGFRGR
jgi:hypothetical protein